MKVQFFPIELLAPTKIQLLSMEPRVQTKIQLNRITGSNKNLTRHTTAVEPQHFKSQRVGYQSNQKLMHYYQHSKNQPNS